MLDSLGGLHAQRVIGSHHSCFHAAEVRRSLHVFKAWNVEGRQTKTKRLSSQQLANEKQGS